MNVLISLLCHFIPMDGSKYRNIETHNSGGFGKSDLNLGLELKWLVGQQKNNLQLFGNQFQSLSSKMLKICSGFSRVLNGRICWFSSLFGLLFRQIKTLVTFWLSIYCLNHNYFLLFIYYSILLYYQWEDQDFHVGLYLRVTSLYPHTSVSDLSYFCFTL